MSKRDNGPEDFRVKPWHAPEMTLSRAVEMNRTADRHSEANPSDPFSRDRVMTYMKRGLILPSEVLADAQSQIEARQRAKVGI